MSLKKSDLEIIYNLMWKNGPSVNGGVKESMIGVYDIPATTLNWEVFKTYLLKNSGTTGNDVKISYLMDSGRVYPIQSQTDFQLALYCFRRKARVGETINLKLERISDQPNHKNLRHSNDVETQFDNNEQCSFISTTCCANNMGDTPPEWFLTSLAQLKKEITEDVTATVTSIVSTALANVQPQVVSQPASCAYYHSRKGKSEKRLRKLMPNFVADGGAKLEAKELIKSMKLDTKLDKLERTANKIKEKRSMLFSATKSSDSEAGHSSSRSRSHDKEDKKMGAQPIKMQEFVPHMLGGEIYLHRWEVKNTGELPWTSKTYLQYTWGSRALEPLEKIITVPHLKPEETGTISARLQVPNEPGRYECYWQFMHKGRRFGHWLGAQLIVDPFDLKGNRSVLETSSRDNELDADEGVSSAPEEVVRHYEKVADNIQVQAEPKEVFDFYKVYQKVSPSNFQDQAQPLLSDSDSESNQDNQSVLSLDGSNNSSSKSLKEEFVLVPSCFKIDNLESGKNDNILVNIEVPSTSGPQIENKEKSKEIKLKNEEKVKQTKVPDDKQAKDCDDVNNNENDAAKSKGTYNGQTVDEGKIGDNSGSGDSDYEVALVVEEDGKPVKDMRTKVKKGTKKDGFVFIKFNNSHPKDQLLHLPKTLLNSDLVQVIDGMEKTKICEESKSLSSRSLQTPTLEAGVEPKQQVQLKVCLEPEKVKGVLLDLSVAGSEKSHSETQDIPNKKAEENKEGAQRQNEMTGEKNVTDECMSHCSAAGSSFSEANPQGKRLFVFPTDCPGYEVVYPVLDQNEAGEPMVYSLYYPSEEQRSNEGQHYSFVPNYQQTPAHLRQNDPFAKAPETDLNLAYDKPLSYNPAYPPNYDDYCQQAQAFYQQAYPDHCATATTVQGQYATATTQGQTAAYATPLQTGQNPSNIDYVYPSTIPTMTQTAAATGFINPVTQNVTQNPAEPKEDISTDFYDMENAQWRYFDPSEKQSSAEKKRSQNARHARSAYLSRAQNSQNQTDAAPEQAKAREAPQEVPTQQESANNIHILPEGIVTGAVNVASSAINTARNVMEMFRPQAPGSWINGHWVSSNPQTPRETNLQALHEMGFWNRDLNATLLARFNDDLNRVVTELVQ